MVDSIEGCVRSGVDAYLRWLPRWRIGTSRARTRLCRLCFGSPVATAAGFDSDTPHAVKHALLSRMKAIVDTAVDDYTTKNLPLVSQELAKSHPPSAGYRPDEGLDVEFQGLEVDPEPDPGQPFLFTLAELATEDRRLDEAARPAVEPATTYSDEAKQALRTELELADDHARSVGTTLCLALVEHRERIAQAIELLVEPQIEVLLTELSESLEQPGAR